MLLEFAAGCITYRSDTSIKDVGNTQSGRERGEEADRGISERYLSTLFSSIRWLFVLLYLVSL